MDGFSLALTLLGLECFKSCRDNFAFIEIWIRVIINQGKKIIYNDIIDTTCGSRLLSGSPGVFGRSRLLFDDDVDFPF